jgi:hypothetical protein
VNNETTPALTTATFFANSIFSLSGFLNVILLLKTRPSSGLFGNLMFLTPARPPLLFAQERDDAETVDMASEMRLPP